MTKMYLMTGISGSGKTTFAKNFVKYNNLLYLNPDNFYTIVNGDSTHLGHQHEFQVWMMLWQAIHCAEISKKNVLIDTRTHTSKDVSDELRIVLKNMFDDEYKNLSEEEIIPNDVVNCPYVYIFIHFQRRQQFFFYIMVPFLPSRCFDIRKIDKVNKFMLRFLYRFRNTLCEPI